ncbi:sensor histidine kinase [Pseudactinotalea sp.]|uniref:sensor histidine kinase n=1 Tax=Pseudactinotalea sp. TaxID=1926260 RepID=UPI003B3B5C74
MKALLSALRRLGRGYSDDAGPISALGLLLVGLVAIALGLKGIWLDASWDTPAWWHVVPLLVGCAGNAVRKSHPAITLGLAVPAFVADAAIGGSLALLLVLFDGIYSAERFGSERLRRVVRFGAGVVVAGVVIAAVLGGLSFQTTAGLTLQIAAMLLIPVWWAMDVRHRSELAEAATARAELEAARAAEQARAQDAERRGAVQAERSRMARELHDSVAGDVSALVIRAGAALAAPPGPADRESLAAVRENGLHALAELRTMIDVLAAEGENEPVAPVLTEDGADLLARFDGTTLDGVPPGALAPLSPVVDRAGYRILQEALTNAARHGAAGTAAVCLSRENGHVRLEVSNAVEHGERGTGLGVTSMTERAHAVGGRVTIDEGAGTWTVAARLPTAEVIR